MAIVAVAYGIIAYGSPWYPINLLAAVALPVSSHISLEELTAFHGLALVVALISHAVLSSSSACCMRRCCPCSRVTRRSGVAS